MTDLFCVRLDCAARQAILPSHLLPRQVLAQHDVQDGAWGRGISDQVVREFDSVFSPRHKVNKGTKVARVPLGGGHAIKGAKHETDKGNFLLKMGLVNKGGYVRVWVPDAPAKSGTQESATAAAAAASKPGAVARSAPGEEYGRKLPAARQTALNQKILGKEAPGVGVDGEKKRCNPALQLGCADAIGPSVIPKQKQIAAFFPKDSISMATKPSPAAKPPAAGASAAVKAAEGISAAVASESKLASAWAHNEGVPQPQLPSTAVEQTREAVADTLSNVLTQAKDAERKFGEVQENMKRLHAAISRVEGVVQRLPSRSHLPMPDRARLDTAGRLAGQQGQAAARAGEGPGGGDWRRMGFMDAERRAAVGRAEELYQGRAQVMRAS